LVIVDADLAGDREGLDKLAFWALQRISPVVAADPPDGLVIDTTGADHLHGGEALMIETMVEKFAASGVEARGGGREHMGRRPCRGPLPAPADRRHRAR
jgi:protein ImuB